MELKDKLSQMFYGRTITDSIKHNKCVSCSKTVYDFRSELDRKEYNISGLCSTCQEEVFKLKD